MPFLQNLTANAAIRSAQSVFKVQEKLLPDETLGKLLVLLATAQMIFAGLNDTFKIPQLTSEIGLGAGLTYLFLKQEWDRTKFITAFFLFSVSVIAFLKEDFHVFAVNLKQYSLGILALFVFSHLKIRVNFLYWIFGLSLILILINHISPDFLAPFINRANFPEYNFSRFGGIFLETHFNAVFSAIIFIHLIQTNNKYVKIPIAIFGLFIMYLLSSKYIFASYIVHITYMLIIYMNNDRIKVIKLNIAISIAILIAFIASIYFSDILINSINRIKFNSLYIIAYQIYDINYYVPILNLFPSSYIEISSNFYADAYPDPPCPDGEKPGTRTTEINCEYWNIFRHNGHNEIGFFSFTTQLGLPLALLYLVTLLNRAKPFALFILMSMTHNVFILSPLIIFMILKYSSDAKVEHSYQLRKHKKSISNPYG